MAYLAYALLIIFIHCFDDTKNISLLSPRAEMPTNFRNLDQYG